MLDAKFWIGSIGYTVLGLLGILLAALLLILFLPIVYRIKGHRNADETVLKIRANWLFGVGRAFYDYPGENVFVVKALCFTIFSFPKPKKKPSDRADEADKEGAESVSDAEDIGAESPEEPPLGRGGHIFAKFKKLKYTIRTICDRIKEAVENISFYKSLWEREDTRELLSYACLRTGKILKNVRPRRLKVRLVYGAGSPDITGYLYALYGMIYPHLGYYSVSVTPDFTQPVLEGDMDIAGHITVFTVIYHILMLLCDERLIRLKRKVDAHRAAMAKKAAGAETADV